MTTYRTVSGSLAIDRATAITFRYFMRDCTEARSVWVNVDAKIPPYYPRG